MSDTPGMATHCCHRLASGENRAKSSLDRPDALGQPVAGEDARGSRPERRHVHGLHFQRATSEPNENVGQVLENNLQRNVVGEPRRRLPGAQRLHRWRGAG